ncbi:hypothetical protein HDU86_008123 [Geranomyces michiganensis]|nr:hypothetical protein HDU86_008123 [Geranomyces michiganensis]
MKLFTSSVALFSVILAIISAIASSSSPIPDFGQDKIPDKDKVPGTGVGEKAFQTHYLAPGKGTNSGNLKGRDEGEFHLEPVKARIGGYKLEGARSPVNVPDKKE